MNRNNFGGVDSTEPACARRSPRSSIGTMSLFARVLFLLALALTAFTARADVPESTAPPYLVIKGNATASGEGCLVPALDLTGSNENDNLRKYVTTSGTLLVVRTTDGVVASGSDEASALAALLDPAAPKGLWDNCSFSFSGFDIVVPQVLVYYPAQAAAPGEMHGYDGVSHPPAGTGTAQEGGAVIAAYAGLSSGYLFRFSETSPIYNYRSGPEAMRIHTDTGGAQSVWPSANSFVFPAQWVASSGTLSAISYIDGFDNGYWSRIDYQSEDGSLYGEHHVYMPPDGSTGNVWGTVAEETVDQDWVLPSDGVVASVTTIASTPHLPEVRTRSSGMASCSLSSGGTPRTGTCIGTPPMACG